MELFKKEIPLRLGTEAPIHKEICSKIFENFEYTSSRFLIKFQK